MRYSNLKVFGSGSSGNSYAIEADGEILLLELGINHKEIFKGIEYKTDLIVGVLVTHSHGDHSKSIPIFTKFGIPVFACADVCGKFKGVALLKTRNKYKIGGFLVTPIPVEHNVECYAYIIEHESFGKLLFATDLNSFPFRIKGLNHILVEANYSENVIVDNACSSKYSSSASNNHLEINQTIDILKANFTGDIQNIVLLHLSEQNSSETAFKQAVIEELGFSNVFVASKGLEVELNKEDF